MLVEESITHEQVERTLRKAKAVHLESVEVFDIFRGKHVPAGKKSMAYSLTYRSASTTLTDKQVNEDHERILQALQNHLGAEMR
jgi:phenylalanyl-tRNA synthetase beta chain